MKKELEDAIGKLRDQVQSMNDEDLQAIIDDQQGTFDGLSEREQEGAPGEELQAVIDALSDASEHLQGAIDSLEEILST
jgi:ABC-type transporter Mla subunit MlaD